MGGSNAVFLKKKKVISKAYPQKLGILENDAGLVHDTHN